MSDPTPQPAGTQPAPAQAEPPATVAASSATFTQEDFNKALAEEKRKWKQQQDEAAAKIKRETEEKAAIEKGEFEKLASERGSKVAQLEQEQATAAERLQAYEAEMDRQIKARLRNLPDEIKAMAPDGDALMRFAWLEKAEQAAAKLAQSRTTVQTPSGPRGSGATPHASPASDDLIAQKRARIGGL